MMRLPYLSWLESPNFSERSSPIDMVCVHDCEGSSQSAINWFRDHRSHVSAHFVLAEGGTYVTQMVALDKKAWHCRAFNSRSIGLEMGGWAERGYPDVEWHAAANIVAYLLHRFKIPVQWAEHGKGAGFARHLDLGKAGGNHQDPTTDPKVWATFIELVKEASIGGGFPTTPWGQ